MLAGPFSTALVAIFLGYGLGSIPFGLLLTRLAGTQDVRTIGSGNIGATNVLRTGRKDLAILTLLLDMAKGALAVLLGAMLSPDAALYAALGAFLGHLFPLWLKFKGGKGVATYLGCLLALSWPAGVLFIVAWLAVAWATRFSSAAALVASAISPAFLLGLHEPAKALLFTCLTGLLWFMHRANIGRLVKGEEGRIGQKA